MAIGNSVGIKFAESEITVEKYFATRGVNMNLDLVRRAAITREECVREVESHFKTTESVLNSTDRKFRATQLEELGIDPVTLELK